MSENPDDPRHTVKFNKQDGEKIAAFIDRQQQFEDELRRAKRAMAAAQKAEDLQKQREACIIALMATAKLLIDNPKLRRERLHRIFFSLAEALDSFNKKGHPDLLVSRRTDGGKAVGTADRVIPATAAAACMQILSDCGEPRNKLRKRVARIFADAGHVTSDGNRISTGTLRDWFKAGLAPADKVAKNVELIRKRVFDSAPNAQNPRENLSLAEEIIRGIAQKTRPNGRISGKVTVFPPL